MCNTIFKIDVKCENESANVNPVNSIHFRLNGKGR